MQDSDYGVSFSLDPEPISLMPRVSTAEIQELREPGDLFPYAYRIRWVGAEAWSVCDTRHNAIVQLVIDTIELFGIKILAFDLVDRGYVIPIVIEGVE